MRNFSEIPHAVDQKEIIILYDQREENKMDMIEEMKKQVLEELLKQIKEDTTKRRRKAKPRKCPIYAALTEEEHGKLKQRAKEEDVRMSDIVYRAIKSHLGLE